MNTKDCLAVLFGAIQQYSIDPMAVTSTILWALGACVLIGAVGAFIMSPPIFDALTEPLSEDTDA